MIDQLIETWTIHNRINRYLLDAVPESALPNVGPAKGRSVGAQFAHLHNVRLMWLQAAAAPEVSGGLTRIEKEQAHEKELLATMLTASGDAIASLVRASLEQGGKIKGFKPHAVAFVGYLIAPDGGTATQVKHASAPAAGVANLRAALADGKPAIVGADMASMPYAGSPGPSDMWLMIPMVVYGYDEAQDAAYMSDRARVPLRVTTAALAAARGRVGKERHRVMTVSLPNLDRLPHAVEEGIAACISMFEDEPPPEAPERQVWLRCL